jgi:hypothetical protein
MELGRVICVPDLAEAAARDEAMRAGVVEGQLADVPDLPGLEDGLRLPGDAHAGRLFVQGMVGRGDRRVRFDDMFGAGWRLVTCSGRGIALDADLAAWFERIGGRVVTLGEGGEVGDPDRTYATWFADRHVIAALQRPDFYLYGTATTGGEAVALITRLRADIAAYDAVPHSATE